MILKIIHKGSSGPDGFLAGFCQTCKQEFIPILHKLSHKIRGRTFLKAKIILISNARKRHHGRRKPQTASLMNISHKMGARNRIWKQVEKIMYLN